MKKWLTGFVFGLCLVSTATALADWHSGTYELMNGGKVVGTQEFTMKRSEASGKLFVASKVKGTSWSLEDGTSEAGIDLSLSLELEADNRFAKYTTAARRKGKKPQRGIFFIHQNKLRAIPEKGVSKPRDLPLEPPDILTLDPVALVSFNLIGQRSVGKVGVVNLEWLSLGTLEKGALSVEKQGTGGMKDKKGKFHEVGLYTVKTASGSGVLAADAAGRVMAGDFGPWKFGLKGWDWAKAFTVPRNPDKVDVAVPPAADE